MRCLAGCILDLKASDVMTALLGHVRKSAFHSITPTRKTHRKWVCHVVSLIGTHDTEDTFKHVPLCLSRPAWLCDGRAYANH
jgi:hypothetical protein